MASLNRLNKLRNTIRRNARISLIELENNYSSGGSAFAVPPTPRTIKEEEEFCDFDFSGKCNSSQTESTFYCPVDTTEDLLCMWQNRESFKKDVAKSTQELLIGKEEAKLEATVKRLIRMAGTKDKALLYVLSKLDCVSEQLDEAKTQMLVNMLLHLGAQPTEKDDNLQTPLHHAVIRNYEGVTRRLLDQGADPFARDQSQALPYTIAVMQNGNDNIAALLLVYMQNHRVRALYTSDGVNPAEFSFHELLRTKLQQTKLGVLDCMMEALPSNRFNIYYSVLEGDQEGRSPKDINFDNKSTSALHILAKTGDKDVIYHDVVRLLLRRKWILFARRRFSFNAVLFLVSMLMMTYAMIIASKLIDPRQYDFSWKHIIRGIFEVCLLLLIVMNFFAEALQICRNFFEYWQDAFNFLDFTSCALLIAVVPLRVLNNSAQWAVFAVGYILWNLRSFKYAPVFRSTGAFAQILWRIITRDFIRFSVVFLIILLTFCGSFTLVMRWENHFGPNKDTSFWGILFCGTRTLVEQQPMTECIDEAEYGPFAVFVMMVYLFTCVVLLLNILIALLSDTYQNVQRDAQRGLELNLAWIVMRVEIYSFRLWLNRGSYRQQHYKEHEEIEDLKQVLNKWENRNLYDSAKAIQDLNDRLDVQDLSMRSIKSRLVMQEESMRQNQENLEKMLRHIQKQLVRLSRSQAESPLDMLKEELKTESEASSMRRSTVSSAVQLRNSPGRFLSIPNSR